MRRPSDRTIWPPLRLDIVSQEARRSPVFDLVVRRGRVVDGTGAPAFEADVAILNGRIVEIGEGLGRAGAEIDAGGMVVAPGFIDVHTHYDAQVFWDPKLSPSSNHGVTTVLAGNCGFSIAPLS